jgi:ABC-type transporter Mla subunit MlaD
VEGRLNGVDGRLDKVTDQVTLLAKHAEGTDDRLDKLAEQLKGFGQQVTSAFKDAAATVATLQGDLRALDVRVARLESGSPYAWVTDSDGALTPWSCRPSQGSSECMV